jgi:glycosyltransferase involved in cell wall biosynthesis
MTTVHIVTSHYPPHNGGLELWTRDLATALLAAGLRIIVYVCEAHASAADPGASAVEIVEIDRLRAPWEEPLPRGGHHENRFKLERSRLTFDCLRAAMEKRLGAGPHLVLSNFITTAGYTAHLVAEALGLPHIPVIAGTDLNRGFRNATERQVILDVCRSARLVVGKSQEQIRTIGRCLPETRCTVIETSVEIPAARWSKPGGRDLVIFSDGGFSFKKGTGVLMDAYVALCNRGVAARLEICGGDQTGQEDYWTRRRRQLETNSKLSVGFRGHIGRDEIVGRIRASDIYASATLGEGSSAARARALCMGIPIVTTACGELADSPHAAHIRLVPVGDAAAFSAAVFDLVAELVDGKLRVDEAMVEQFRSRFDPTREWPQWVSVLQRVATAGLIYGSNWINMSAQGVICNETQMFHDGQG